MFDDIKTTIEKLDGRELALEWRKIMSKCQYNQSFNTWYKEELDEALKEKLVLSFKNNLDLI